MAIERISVSDLKAQLEILSNKLDLAGVARLTLTKDIDVKWTLIAVDKEGGMKSIYGPTGIREMTAFLDGIIWMIENG